MSDDNNFTLGDILWEYADYTPPEPDPVPVRRAAPAPKPKAITDGSGQSGVLAALLSNKAFHDTLRAEILEVLRTQEGQNLLADIVRKEISKQK